MLKYTICFIKQGDKILLLNREKPGWMGNWNGVGGHIEKGETPKQSVIREILEETGLTVNSVEFKGIVTWRENDIFTGGMYAFVAELSESIAYETPKKTAEGILDWKNINWILHPRNMGVASIPSFLPKMLSDKNHYEYCCSYIDNSLKNVDVKPYQQLVD